jgi:hypothetical protein
VREEPPQQLDIFAHSRGVILRNAVIEAVDRYDAAAQPGQHGRALTPSRSARARVSRRT